MSKKCPYCGEHGSYENRAFKKAGKVRCKNGKCRVMFFTEQAQKATEIESGMEEFKEKLESVDGEVDKEDIDKLKDALK